MLHIGTPAVAYNILNCTILFNYKAVCDFFSIGNKYKFQQNNNCCNIRGLYIHKTTVFLSYKCFQM